MRRASRMGVLETMSRLRTRSFDEMERSGRMTRFGMRRYSMGGRVGAAARPVSGAWPRLQGTVGGGEWGEEQGRGEGGGIFQFIVGGEGREVGAGDRQMEYGVFVPERTAGRSRFERHWAGSRTAGRDAYCAVRTERAENFAGSG